MKKALLFLTFNRRDTTKLVFEQIKIAKPPRLYLASDGPRADKKDENELVNSIRKYVLDNIDWDCEVKTLFREENLGCGKAISSAITWFFEQEEDGIILEDDCLPDQSFFSFCETLLDHYKNDKRVWHIAGDCPLGNIDSDASYYFGKIMHCWGWAGWADRWKNYKFDVNEYDEKIIKHLSKRKEVQYYWLKVLSEMKRHKIDTWDYQWTFAITKNKGLCVTPCKNLVSNIGLIGIHFTKDMANSQLNKKTYAIKKIVHPKKIDFNEDIIEKVFTELEHDKKKTFKDYIGYVKTYPLFLFRKNFWVNIKTLYFVK